MPQPWQVPFDPTHRWVLLICMNVVCLLGFKEIALGLQSGTLPADVGSRIVKPVVIVAISKPDLSEPQAYQASHWL